MTKIQAAIVGAIIAAALLIPLVVQQHNRAQQAQIENQSLQERVKSLEALAAENQNLTKQLAHLRDSEAASSNQMKELLGLRSAVGALRRENEAYARAAAKNSTATNAARQNTGNLAAVLDAPTVALKPAEAWSNAGYATPEAAFETLYWAMLNHDTNALSKSLSWNPEARAKADALFASAPEAVRERFGSVDGLVSALMGGLAPMTGYGIVSQNIDGDSGTLVEQHQYKDGRVRQNEVTLQHFDDGWRVVLGDEKLLRGFDAAIKRASARAAQ